MSDGTGLWEELSEELVATEPAITRSTMMGLPCLRLDGAFFASLDTRGGELIVKLAADDVAARVSAGGGRPFAPAGKVFREVDRDRRGRRGDLEGSHPGRADLRAHGVGVAPPRPLLKNGEPGRD